MHFTFCILWCFDILGPCWSWRDFPSQGQPIPRDRKPHNCLEAHCSDANQTIQSPQPTHLLCLTFQPLSPSTQPSSLGRYQTTWGSPCALEPWDLLIFSLLTLPPHSRGLWVGGWGIQVGSRSPWNMLGLECNGLVPGKAHWLIRNPVG